MEKVIRSCWLVVALLLALVSADTCSSFGVDYSNGGSYYIDGSSNQYFSFITIFQGCNQESISPVLVGPDDNQYACSNVNTTPAGSQVTSTCGIPFSSMQSGTWTIIVQGSQIAVQRSITLTVGVPQTTVVTATPTITIGITSTPKAQTVQSTILQTVTLIVVAPTVTQACNGATKTVTNTPQGSTVTVTSTVVRTNDGGTQTSFWTTTVSTTAYCHYPSSVYTTTTTRYDNNPITTAQPSWCVGNNCQPTWSRGGGGWGWGSTGRRTRPADATNTAAAAKNKREAAAANKVAAVTSTYTETTYTVTRTLVTTIPAQTTTELVVKTTTATVTPPATTICNGGSNQGATVTVIKGNPSTTTQTNVSYQTTQVAGTVWVGQTEYTTLTNSASATACWQAGGWFGGAS